MKLYEFNGFIKVACVIAATSEEQAQAFANGLGATYLHDEIGLLELDSEPVDVRALGKGVDPEEVAHYVVRRGKAS